MNENQVFVVRYLLPGICVIASCLLFMAAFWNVFVKNDPDLAAIFSRKNAVAENVSSEAAASETPKELGGSGESDFYKVGQYTIDVSTGFVYTQNSAGMMTVVTDTDGKPLTSDNLTVAAP